MKIYSRDQHPISRRNISESALKVLYRLNSCGYEAYLVGGGVRDLLLGGKPKDFDIATNATPEQVREAFRNCRLIGRRFRLAHVRFGREVIEVATFRGHGDDGDRSVEDGGRLLRDNIYGDIEEDALRRDFTVNGLYYSIDGFTVRDEVGGMADLESRTLRMIGDPDERFPEDPVRCLRAARFAAKLDFEIESKTADGIRQYGQLLDDIPSARLFDEVLKLFLSGHAERSYLKLREFGLFKYLFPSTDKLLESDEGFEKMLRACFNNTDQRIEQDLPVTPAFLYAVLLWAPMKRHADRQLERGMSPHDAIHHGADWVLNPANMRTALPRRFSTPMREIWLLQPRLEGKTRASAKRIMSHPRFRAGYDFLLIRVLQEPLLEPVAERWTEAQEQGPEVISRMQHKPRKRRRRRRGRGGPDKAAEAG